MCGQRRADFVSVFLARSRVPSVRSDVCCATTLEASVFMKILVGVDVVEVGELRAHDSSMLLPWFVAELSIIELRRRVNVATN